MLHDGKVRTVPGQGQQFSGGLLVAVRERIGFFGGFGAGIPMDFHGGLQDRSALGYFTPVNATL